MIPNTPGNHQPDDLGKTSENSLTTIVRIRSRVLYLHAPDRSVLSETQSQR